MSDRFVSGGVIDSRGESTGDTHEASGNTKGNSKNSEWEAVQKELEAERKRREEQRIKAASGEERSLYDILQANKEAKQAAFEEQNKLRNQFRALDDDEINFLDEVRERERKAEEEKKRELEDGLKAFREARKAEGPTINTDEEGKVEGDVAGESWEVSGRKRKRVKGKEREVKGVRRKVGEGEGDDDKDKQEAEIKRVAKSEAKSEAKGTDKVNAAGQAKTTSGRGGGGGGGKALGLVDYGSDDSDDE